jgi:Winged helix DNA-binding domain
MTTSVSREQVVRFRARVSHLHEKLPAGSFAQAAWGGLQDSVPRAGVISLHARVEETKPNSWEDPSLVQIWFRGGADYIVPRDDVGIFTLGSFPRDPAEGRRLERLADDIHRAIEGEMRSVREVYSALPAEQQRQVRFTGMTGRIHIRWDASNIWLIPVERPDIDVEDARLELTRRFLHWFGPTTVQRLARWTGVQRDDAAATWKGLEKGLIAVQVDGEERFMLAADMDALVGAEPVIGVRLTPFDDPFTKLDQELLVVDERLRARVFPPTGQSLGYIPGAIVVDGEIVGAWQRQQRRVTIHPWARPIADVRAAIEQEALAFPIAGASNATVSWD